ncbi:MAG: universal stress protein [Terriglobales bacterium]
MLPIKRILCPTDFSGPACTCVRTASELAEHFGAELMLINVVPAVPTLPPDPNYVFKIPEYEQYLHADAEKQLSKAREELVGRNVKVRTMVGHGSAAEEIVLVAKKDGADLIVISTHGSTGLERWVFGSVAEKVVRLAECPVLTVRQAKEAA